ncbi:MAG: MATE family efflux transporter [Lachnospiraceae bacterium]|nr:MATE family efflux transporter [Lachnospiraceae bacterium]
MKQINLLEAPVRQAFISYLMPSVSATLVTSIYILADTVMIGRGIGAAGMAALNLLLPLYSVYFGLGMLCGVGGSVLFCFERGRGNEKAARGYFTTALFMAVVFAVSSFCLCRTFFDPLLVLLGNTDSMTGYARPYGLVLVTAAPVFVFSSFLQAFVRNDGAPRLAMAGVISGGVTNVILDYVTIYVLKWGMGGAALSTAAGSTLTVLILSAHFFAKENHLRPVPTLSLRKMREIISSGLASFLMEVSSGLVTFLFNRQLLAYVGDIGVVVYGIISNTALVVLSVSNGIAQAVQPLLAMNFGAGKRARVREASTLGIRTALFVGVLFMAVGLLFPTPLSHLFLDPSPEVLLMAVPAIRLYFICFPASEWNILCSAYFQSTVRPGISLTISLLRGVVLNSFFVFFLPVFFGVNGIWLTVTASEFLTAAVTAFFMKKELTHNGAPAITIENDK